MRHSAWMLAALLGFGIFTWIGFVYIAVRTRRRSWIVAAAFYVLAAAAFIVISIVEGAESSANVAGGIGATTWLVGIGHAFVVRPAWLRWRAFHDPWRPPVTAPQHPGAPPLPPLAPAAPAALVNVNTATHEELSRLPWFTADRTIGAIVERERRGRFYSVEEFAAAANLSPEQLHVVRALITL